MTLKEKQEKPIIAWWSGGVTSAVACKLALNEYNEDVEIVFCDTHHEHLDTYRFLHDCEKWYKRPIKVIANPRFADPLAVWYHYGALNHATGAICSTHLKQRVRIAYQNTSMTKAQVFGFEAGEEKRANNMQMNYPEINPTFPLIEQSITKPMAIQLILGANIAVPKMYELGFSNNNCFGSSESGYGGCVQGGAGYWKKIREDYPKKFAAMAKIEHEISIRKGKPVTMLRKKTKARGTEPIFLLACEAFPNVRTIDAMSGRDPKNMMECNGFCGTYDVELDPMWRST